MITEDYCDFETAKLLKDKGFDEPCYACYIEDEISYYDYCSANHELIEEVVAAPTLQMAMKWLREVHSIEVHISLSALNSDGSREYMFDVFFTNERYLEPSKTKAGFGCYEEAARAAIKYCLENLMQ